MGKFANNFITYLWSTVVEKFAESSRDITILEIEVYKEFSIRNAINLEFDMPDTNRNREAGNPT